MTARATKKTQWSRLLIVLSVWAVIGSAYALWAASQEPSFFGAIYGEGLMFWGLSWAQDMLGW